MSAPAGNQFWKLRASHGRDLIFSSPPVLLEACVEYFEEWDKRIWVKEDWVGKDAILVKRKTIAPYTLTSLYTFLDITAQTWKDYRGREGFLEITTRVEQIMFTQKFEGAAVGAFNPNIIARDLGLKEISETTVNDNRKSAAALFPTEEEFEEAAKQEKDGKDNQS
jgi:hypothetical protein